MVTPEQFWPPFALTVTAGPLTLQAVRDEDMPALLELVLAGVHDPAVIPFSTPWTDAAPADLLRQSAAYYWRSRADFSPASWSLDLVVSLAGEIVGVQALFGENFPVTRVAETGSWLGRAHQGRGIGTLMRQAACALVLDHLAASSSPPRPTRTTPPRSPSAARWDTSTTGSSAGNGGRASWPSCDVSS